MGHLVVFLLPSLVKVQVEQWAVVVDDGADADISAYWPVHVQCQIGDQLIPPFSNLRQRQQVLLLDRH